MKLKVVCLNIWNGGIVFEPMMAFLQEQAADVYLFQEVFDDLDPTLEKRYRSRQLLTETLELKHQHFAPTFLEEVDGREIVQGNFILSRFPLQEVSIIHYDVPFQKRENVRPQFPFTPRTLHHVIADVEGKPLHLLNTQGIWGEDGFDTPRRIEMAKTIVREVEKAGSDPVFLAGDFNVVPNTKTISLIEEKLVNVFKDELKTSFNVPRKDLVRDPGFATAVVDMVFVSKNIRVLSHNCLDVDVSDHLPFIVEIELP